MPETPGGIAALNWPALVAEAIRRRKSEKMTQKAHAALASVSIPTIIAFDRGERTVSLAKAIDILRVVGLIEKPAAETTQEVFVGAAFARWRALTKELPRDSAGRFPHGWYRIDYALDGELKEIELHKLPELLGRAMVRHTGWPMFRLPRGTETQAYETDGVVECWFGPGDDRPFTSDAAHCDFWRAAPTARLFLIRGYQEDSQETFRPGTLFDTTLPIWRIGEGLLHAGKLAKLMARDPTETQVRFRIMFTGLGGRDLRAWASPMSVDHFGGGRSRADEAILECTVPAARIATNLVSYVGPLAHSLFERFGVAGVGDAFVRSELDRMRDNRFGDQTPESRG